MRTETTKKSNQVAMNNEILDLELKKRAFHFITILYHILLHFIFVLGKFCFPIYYGL